MILGSLLRIAIIIKYSYYHEARVITFIKNVSICFVVKARVSPGKKMRETIICCYTEKRELWKYNGIFIYICLSYGEYVIFTGTLSPTRLNFFYFMAFQLCSEILSKNGCVFCYCSNI